MKLTQVDKKAFEIITQQLNSRKHNEQFFDDPVAWAEYMLGATLWSRQRDICIDIKDNRNIAIKAGHGVGKSFLVALLICWWIDTRYPNAFVASTAPSQKQIGAIVWREVRLMKDLIERRFKEEKIDHKLVGYITANNEWKDDSGTPIGIGVRPPEQKEESAVQGIHAEYVLALGDEACHDDQTDVLTLEGWKNWADVRPTDKLLTWNTHTNEYEYLVPQKLVAYPYVGDMYHYKNNETDFKVTPNHDMIFESGAGLQRKQIQDITLSNKFMFRNLPYWQGVSPTTFELPEYISERKTFPARTFDIRDWAAFLGWVGSEGSLTKNGYETVIWQTKECYRAEIRSLLTRMQLDFVEREDSFAVYGGQINNHLQGSGRTTLDKRVPEYVKLWDKDLIDVYLDAYIKGDGYFREGRNIIYTSGKDMANDLQELALKAGYGSTVTVRPPVTSQPLADGRRITSTRDGYVITLSQFDRKIKLKKESLTVEHYDGMVYCATMPKNNTLFTRRSGKTLWSGNCGLSEEMIDGLSNITSNTKSRRILIGNPTNPASYFAKIFKSDTGTWALRTISVLDSPHFTDEKDTLPESVLSKLSGHDYVEEKKRDYGEDSPRYKARVMGEFAYDLGDTLIKETDVLTATDKEFFVPSEGVRRILGCDIARFGKDSSVVYMCELLPDGTRRIRLLDHWEHDSRVTESADRIHKLAREYYVHEVRVDGHGIGGGVIDNLLLKKGSYRILDMNSNATTSDKKQWHNARAYWWDEMRRMMREGLIDLDLADERLRDEFCSVEYKFSKQSGGLLVESKDEMAKRGQKSPDFADAAIYSGADMSYLEEQEDLNNIPVGTVMEFDGFDAEMPYIYGI